MPNSTPSGIRFFLLTRAGNLLIFFVPCGRRAGVGAIVMGALIVTCPNTQKKFSTGVQIDADSFLLVEFNALVVAYCPHCEQKHSWRYRDAKYVDVIAPEDWWKTDGRRDAGRA
jgi:hypothetical protein